MLAGLPALVCSAAKNLHVKGDWNMACNSDFLYLQKKLLFAEKFTQHLLIWSIFLCP